MAETIHVRGEGGAIFAMDLPLAEPIAERLANGQLQRVNEDGSPWYGQSTPSPGPGAEPSGQQTPDPPPADRPAQAAPKADWIDYVVRRGLLSREDAEAYTKADLIAMVS